MLKMLECVLKSLDQAHGKKKKKSVIAPEMRILMN